MTCAHTSTMDMITKRLMLTSVKIILLLGLLIRAKSEAKLRMIYNNGHDALFVARCEAKCWHLENKGCIKECLAKPFKKPGICPQNITTLSPFARVCLRSCHVDSQCPRLEKCCQHSCGVTCQEPDSLLSAVDVPEIPRDITITERRKRTIHIEWTAQAQRNVPESSAVVIYLIEERHHSGKHFTESKLSKWTPFVRTNKTSCVLKRIVKPGSWYLFRVAAVNENGSKGYSESSTPFSISITPKPPKAPLNMTVGPLFKTKNGSLNVELKWKEPPSDLPIQRYKVFWSIRLHGIKALDSVLVRHQVVPKDQTSFLLQNLTENSPYFLQVQAISQYDSQRLKSEKSNLVLNTTNYINVTDYPYPNQLTAHSKVRIEDLKLEKLYWSKGDLKAKISWESQNNGIRYMVTWWQSVHCQQSTEWNHSKLSAITTLAQFELYDIKFSCRYRVTVREISPEGKKSQQDTSITFETPSCKKLKILHRKIKCTE